MRSRCRSLSPCRPRELQMSQDGPLAGLKVLELSSFVSASFAGTLLGDFGAEVVKVELPGKGDMQRGLGTFTPEDDERNLWWMALARNKRSVGLDLRAGGDPPGGGEADRRGGCGRHKTPPPA